MVARNDFIEQKQPKIALDIYAPRPLPEGRYLLHYGVGEIAAKCPINNTRSRFTYICVPGFFSLIKSNGVPTITVSGPYILDRQEE